MQHLDVPFERLIVNEAVDAIPLKLAYSNPKDPANTQPVVPSAQAIYGNETNKSEPDSETNVWFIALACITVLVVILLISYYIINTLGTRTGVAATDVDYDEYERE